MVVVTSGVSVYVHALVLVVHKGRTTSLCAFHKGLSLIAFLSLCLAPHIASASGFALSGWYRGFGTIG